jgi:hypothetical protein
VLGHVVLVMVIMSIPPSDTGEGSCQPSSDDVAWDISSSDGHMAPFVKVTMSIPSLVGKPRVFEALSTDSVAWEVLSLAGDHFDLVLVTSPVLLNMDFSNGLLLRNSLLESGPSGELVRSSFPAPLTLFSILFASFAHFSEYSPVSHFSNKLPVISQQRAKTSKTNPRPCMFLILVLIQLVSI